MTGTACYRSLIGQARGRAKKKILEPLVVPECFRVVEKSGSPSYLILILIAFSSQSDTSFFFFCPTPQEDQEPFIHYPTYFLSIVLRDIFDMFRQGFRRCASLASAAAPFAVVRNRAALTATPRTVLSISRPATCFKSIIYASRNYSSEATAVDAGVPETETPGEIVNFADLTQFGVHQNLLNVIIKDMRYETMTPVQSKTINPALKGTDM